MRLTDLIKSKADCEEQYRDASNLNARSAIYRFGDQKTTPWPRWVFEQLALPSNARVLELGCGSGALWSAVVPAGHVPARAAPNRPSHEHPRDGARIAKCGFAGGHSWPPGTTALPARPPRSTRLTSVRRVAWRISAGTARAKSPMDFSLIYPQDFEVDEGRKP